MYVGFGITKKDFVCEDHTFTISNNEKEKKRSSFILSREGTSITEIIAIECNKKVHFVTKRPSWTFWSPFNRAAIKEAKNILETMYRHYH